MEVFYIILGLGIIYSTAHFFIVQHSKEYKKRSGYEKIITWVGIVSISIIYLSVMFPSN